MKKNCSICLKTYEAVENENWSICPKCQKPSSVDTSHQTNPHGVTIASVLICGVALIIFILCIPFCQASFDSNPGYLVALVIGVIICVLSPFFIYAFIKEGNSSKNALVCTCLFFSIPLLTILILVCGQLGAYSKPAQATTDTSESAQQNTRFEDYRRAAERGDAFAQKMLGCCYLYGLEGIAKDEVEAVKWVRKAAEQGDATAQYILGSCYETKDKVEAVKWLQKAAEQGNEFAQRALKALEK